MKQAHSTAGAPKAVGPYSQAVSVGNLIFCSGQIHLTAESKLLAGSIEDQTRQVMSNLDAVLKAAGAGFDDVVKSTIFLTDMSVYAKVNEVYGSYLTEPFPARETVGVAALPLGASVEISVIAVKGASS